MQEVERELESKRASSVTPGAQQAVKDCKSEAEVYISLLRPCMRVRNTGRCLTLELERTARKLAAMSGGTQQHATQTRRLNVLKVLTAPQTRKQGILQEWESSSGAEQPAGDHSQASLHSAFSAGEHDEL